MHDARSCFCFLAAENWFTDLQPASRPESCMFPLSRSCVNSQTHATQQSPGSHEFAQSILHKNGPKYLLVLDTMVLILKVHVVGITPAIK